MNDQDETTVYEDEYRGRKILFLPTDTESAIPKYKMFIDRMHVATCSLAEGREMARVMIDNLASALFMSRD